MTWIPSHPTSATSTHSRRGMLLVIVAGIAAMLFSVAMVFILRLRNDAGEMDVVVRETQARLMFYAACNYIQETSRVGWNDEAYGWVDPRDGTAGPRGASSSTASAGAAISGISLTPVSPPPAASSDPHEYLFSWPAQGSVARCPMHRIAKPRYAIASKFTYNPVPAQGAPSGELGDWRRYARLTNPDPWPVAKLSGETNWRAIAPDEYLTGPIADVKSGFNELDDTPVTQSANKSWFRVHRELAHPARFTITCGAGATQGFRSWSEVQKQDERNGNTDWQEYFLNSQTRFNELRSQERILWFRVEWAPNVNQGTSWNYRYDAKASAGYGMFYVTGGMSPVQPPLQTTSATSDWARANGDLFPSVAGTRLTNRNLLGTIYWIMRLEAEPSAW